jgi:hypothetical protein
MGRPRREEGAQSGIVEQPIGKVVKKRGSIPTAHAPGCRSASLSYLSRTRLFKAGFFLWCTTLRLMHRCRLPAGMAAVRD